MKRKKSGSLFSEIFSLIGKIFEKPKAKEKALMAVGGALLTAATVAASSAVSNTVDKIFKDKSKSLDEKLAEYKKLKNAKKITAGEYKKCRARLINHGPIE